MKKGRFLENGQHQEVQASGERLLFQALGHQDVGGDGGLEMAKLDTLTSRLYDIQNDVSIHKCILRSNRLRLLPDHPTTKHIDRRLSVAARILSLLSSFTDCLVCRLPLLPDHATEIVDP